MTRQLEIRRHTDNDGDLLTADGIADAVAIGTDELEGDYALAASSGAQRATQTLACFLAGLGEEVPRGVLVVPGFRSTQEDAWRGAYEQAGSGHIDDLKRVAPDLVQEDGEVLGAALRTILDRLEDGERALVVGHSPTSEAGVLSLTGEVVEPLGKGEGVLVTADDGGGFAVERL
jgi:broad specificity phosphatase PhoE